MTYGLECPAGLYSNASTLYVCEICPCGFSVDNTVQIGANSCTLCPNSSGYIYLLIFRHILLYIILFF